MNPQKLIVYSSSSYYSSRHKSSYFYTETSASCKQPDILRAGLLS
ncbi:unnamed protein product [Moneuplotes crassus]|uniref:Uncharacterized protein n=1 Tax=Euplotes crassus TaxID=5936 RepID=A0AAD1XUB0_EUPCR|nr:unnamed protein product [Moneuplotes crassus]